MPAFSSEYRRVALPVVKLRGACRGMVCHCGLSGTVKARDICETVSASRLSLADFYGDGAGARVGAILGEMRPQRRPIKPHDLGLIGAEHLRAKFESIIVASESFCDKRADVEYGGVPYLAEAAFGYCPDGDDDRRIIIGINWSPRKSCPSERANGPIGS